MTQWAEIHLPCPCGKHQGCYSLHKDGHGFCHSCNKPFNGKTDTEMDTVNAGFTYEYLARRGITKETHEFFGVKTQIDAEGKPVSVVYQHPKGYAQIRFLNQKDFRFRGTVVPGGFCTNLFPAGSSKAITVTEGFDDAMSVWQMLGKHPVYPVKSASSALSDVRADYDYLSSFEKIYLALDDDEAGQKATREVAAVFGYGKIHLLKLAPLKDPHDYLEQKREKEFKNLWWNAARWQPDTVISSFEDIRKEFSKRKDVIRYSWPWANFQRMTGGIELHRQYLLTGLEGTGKTEELHEVFKHLVDEYPDMNFGLVHAEEPVVDTVTLQTAKHLRKPIHLEEHRMKDEDILNTWEKWIGRPDRVHFFRHFGSEDTDILLSTIRFMVAACGCRVVFLDNYQHLVSGRTKDRDTEALDYLANRLEALVKELDFALIAISHENDDEKTRGSRNISKECDVWINIKRDMKNENEFVRNLQVITFNKNRQAGKTGPAGRLHYDQETATLSEFSGELPT